MAKFCVKCGIQLDNDGFCHNCGKAVIPQQTEMPPAAQPQYQQQPAQPQYDYTQQQYNNQQPQQQYGNAPTPRKPKNKLPLYIIIGVAAVVVIVVLILTVVIPIGNDASGDNEPVVETTEEDTPEEEPPVIEPPVVAPPEEEPPDDNGSDEPGLGGRGDTSGEWPDNEFTRLVPKPDFAVIFVIGDEERITIAFDNPSEAQMRAYAKQLESAGFTIDVWSWDDPGVRYTYEAGNAAGYYLELHWNPEYQTLDIWKGDRYGRG